MRAFIFPGQGSQSVGMGRALAEASRDARLVLEEVDEALGEKLSRLMADIGFAKAGDVWRWRGRRAEKRARREAGSHAFAELAKLRRQ